MDVKQLLARIADQRKHWVDLPDGKRLQYLRPQEVDLPEFIQGVRLEHVVRYACGWERFTEADLLGASVGSAEAVPFDTEVWDAVVRDRSHYLPPISQAMVETASAFLAQRAAVEKNSEPS